VRVCNFSAGPSSLPLPVLQRLQKEITSYADGKYWVGEISHRGEEFMRLAAACQMKIRTILNIPNTHKILFLQGGISSQYPLIPLNFLESVQRGAYFITGHWSQRAFNLAYHPEVFTLQPPKTFTSIPQRKIPSDLGYLYVCDNETVHGVEFPKLPDCKNIVLDATSNIFTKNIDFSHLGAVVFSTQKNLGISGLAIMIVRDDFLEKSRKKQKLSPIFRFSEILRYESMLNTPNTVAIYIADLVLDWIIEKGGIEYFSKASKEKSDLLYNFIDESDFYENKVEKKFRSRLNIPFSCKKAENNQVFLEQAEAAGLFFLKGHRVVGGMRASIYNSMNIEAVKKLVDFMKNFKDNVTKSNK
jgi:phosphoserine aminotransferase